MVVEVKEVRRRRGSCRRTARQLAAIQLASSAQTNVELRAEDGGSVERKGHSVDLDETLTLLQDSTQSVSIADSGSRSPSGPLPTAPTSHRFRQQLPCSTGEPRPPCAPRASLARSAPARVPSRFSSPHRARPNTVPRPDYSLNRLQNASSRLTRARATCRSTVSARVASQTIFASRPGTRCAPQTGRGDDGATYGRGGLLLAESLNLLSGHAGRVSDDGRGCWRRPRWAKAARRPPDANRGERGRARKVFTTTFFLSPCRFQVVRFIISAYCQHRLRV